MKIALKLPLASKCNVLGGGKCVSFALLIFYEYLSGSFIK